MILKNSVQIHSKILGKEEQNTTFQFLVIFQLVLCFLQSLNYGFGTLETTESQEWLEIIKMQSLHFD